MDTFACTSKLLSGSCEIVLICSVLTRVLHSAASTMTSSRPSRTALLSPRTRYCLHRFRSVVGSRSLGRVAAGVWRRMYNFAGLCITELEYHKMGNQ